MLVCFNCILKLLSSLFIILPFLFTGANCEESSSRWTLYPVCSNGLWGYIDQQGELVLPYQWSYLAISEEMDMLWFARSLVNMESSRRLETI